MTMKDDPILREAMGGVFESVSEAQYERGEFPLAAGRRISLPAAKNPYPYIRANMPHFIARDRTRNVKFLEVGDADTSGNFIGKPKWTSDLTKAKLFNGYRACGDVSRALYSIYGDRPSDAMEWNCHCVTENEPFIPARAVWAHLRAHPEKSPTGKKPPKDTPEKRGNPRWRRFPPRR